MKNTFFTKALLTALLTVPATQVHATIVEINTYKRNTFVESLIVGVATAVIYGLASEACKSDETTYTYTYSEPSYIRTSDHSSHATAGYRGQINPRTDLEEAQYKLSTLQEFIRSNTRGNSIENSAKNYTRNSSNNAFTPCEQYPFLNFAFGIERQIENAQQLLSDLKLLQQYHSRFILKTNPPQLTIESRECINLINQTIEIINALKSIHTQVTFYYRYHQELAARSYQLDRMIPQYYR